MRYIALTLAMALGCAPLSAAGSKTADRLGDARQFLFRSDVGAGQGRPPKTC